jgi:DNA replication protein DnaC
VAEEKKPLSETAELKTELLKYAAIPQERKMEEFLRTEDDGQITLAIGEENVLEKQITGQMTIEEILEAWEEKKRQARAQMEKSGDRREAVLYETGEITGLLEDFIPRTPKEVQELMEEIETETEPATEEITLEEVVVEAEAETEEQSVEETAMEEPVAEETAEEEVVEEETVTETIEDDLPMDIDFAEALEAALEESEEKEEKTETSVSQNTASMLDAIERALAMEAAPVETAGNYMTEEQEKIFAYFTSVDGMKKQLVNLLAEDSIYASQEDSNTGNLIITGHPGNGKTTLAIDIVKAFQKQRKTKGGKLAKVTGDGFNKKNPEEVVSKLGGGALIIERAGSMSTETIESLCIVMEGSTGGLLVILEDDASEIAALLEKNQRFAKKFNRSVDIPIFSNDELVAFGKSYAEEKEYYFDEMAVLALYDCIGVRQTSDHVVNITEVKEFVDDAIAHADKKSKGLFARLSKKRIDEDGNKLLLEEDFDY